jgi:3-dehydroquinate synthase
MELTQNSNQILFENQNFSNLNIYIENNNFSSIFIFTDTIVNTNCLSILLPNLETLLPIEIIEIEPGEEQKNIEICVQLWQLLLDYGADKKSLMINLGGGVISDLGGFIASTFKRGISFINIPTTLLAMVDASIGGKNGIDFGVLKNQIGTISNPELILIYPNFLKTLPQNHLLSGFSEMLKHALIADKNHWNEIKNLKLINYKSIQKYINTSIDIKKHISFKDPSEQNLRKLLNFGHTLGHAIESCFLENNQEITHGHAVAIGMQLESYLSYQLNHLTFNEFSEINSCINSLYPSLKFPIKSINKIIELLKFDKKNSHGKVKFSIIDRIGSGIWDVEIDNQMIINAFECIKKN